jgi:hypothetical protein
VQEGGSGNASKLIVASDGSFKLCDGVLFADTKGRLRLCPFSVNGSLDGVLASEERICVLPPCVVAGRRALMLSPCVGVESAVLQPLLRTRAGSLEMMTTRERGLVRAKVATVARCWRFAWPPGS